jgi:hypothetical protein
MADIELSTMRKVAWRLVPFLGLAYFINALDRFNVSIAALTMNKALGLSATTYGLGAGAFFLELRAVPVAGQRRAGPDWCPAMAGLRDAGLGPLLHLHRVCDGHR